jgi:predicted TPR repeat methyltransferase
VSKDYFQQQAGSYEQDANRTKNVENIANAILNQFDFGPISHLLDFGSGTGLLLEKIAPFVDKITAVDVSVSMNRVLNEKKDLIESDLEILEMDLTTSKLQQRFGGIISSMTMHHIEDIQAMFHDFYEMLDENGILAIADLEIEDGSFHTADTGVFHFGFDRDTFLRYAEVAGFKNLTFDSVSIARKPHGDYPIFLLCGKK